MDISSEASDRASKRQRVAISCSTCRKRKIKCDKQRPVCSSCIKNRIPAHLCIYDESPFISSAIKEKNLYDEINKLRAENDDLIKRQASLIKENTSLSNELFDSRKISPSSNPHFDSESDQTNETPENTFDDTDFYSLVDFISIIKKPNRTVYFGPTSWKTLLKHDPDSYPLFTKFSTKLHDERTAWKARTLFSKKDKTSVFFDVNKRDTKQSASFLRLLEDFLPSRCLVRLHINKTLDYNCMISPFFDKKVVHTAFEEIFLVDPVDAKKIKLKITHKNADFAQIACILLIVKFSLLTIATRTDHREILAQFSDEQDKILSFIPQCLSFANSFIKASVPALQTMILMRLYKNFNPYDGDGGDSSNGSLLFGMIFNMSLALGLHRDIEKMYSNEGAAYIKPLKNMWRWILYFDSEQSFNLGTPLMIGDEFFDHNIETDKDDFLFYKKTLLIRSIMKDMLNLNRKVNIEHQIRKVKQFINQYCHTSVSDLIVAFEQEEAGDSDIDLKIHYTEKTYLHLSLYSVLQSLYHLLYLLNYDHPEKSVKYRMLGLKYSLLFINISQRVLRVTESCDHAPDTIKLSFLQAFFLFLIRTLSLKGSTFILSVCLKQVSAIDSSVEAFQDYQRKIRMTDRTLESLTIAELQDINSDDDFPKDDSYGNLFDNVAAINTYVASFHKYIGLSLKNFYGFYPIYICSRNFCNYIDEKLKSIHNRYSDGEATKRDYASPPMKLGFRSSSDRLSVLSRPGVHKFPYTFNPSPTSSSSISGSSVDNMSSNTSITSADFPNEYSNIMSAVDQVNTMSLDANHGGIDILNLSTPNNISLNDNLFEFDLNVDDNFSQMLEFKDLFYL